MGVVENRWTPRQAASGLIRGGAMNRMMSEVEKRWALNMHCGQDQSSGILIYLSLQLRGKNEINDFFIILKSYHVRIKNHKIRLSGLLSLRNCHYFKKVGSKLDTASRAGQRAIPYMAVTFRGKSCPPLRGKGCG